MSAKGTRCPIEFCALVGPPGSFAWTAGPTGLTPLLYARLRRLARRHIVDSFAPLAAAADARPNAGFCLDFSGRPELPPGSHPIFVSIEALKG